VKHEKITQSEGGELRAQQVQNAVLCDSDQHDTGCKTGNKSCLKPDNWRTQSSATVRTALRRYLSTLLLRKCRLRRTAGGTRFDDLAASAEKLLGCAVHTLD